MEFVKPTFKKTEKGDFFKKLQKDVRENVLNNPKHQAKIQHKTFFFLFTFTLSYIAILTFGNILPVLFVSYIIMGISMIALFVNSFHDAAHYALFKTRAYNDYFTNILELFGSSSYLWKKRHILLHHPYPNIQNWDVDIKQSDVVRIFPTAPLFNYHKYQHIYVWLLYPMYTLNWLFIRDFKDFFGSKDNYLKRIHTIPTIEYYKLFLSKIINILFMIVIPTLVLGISVWTILLAWFVMHLCSSIVGVVALISTHVDETAEFPLPPEDGDMGVSWAEHQMNATKDFGTSNFLANLLYGGFTHHVAHHLFPTVAHTYYPEITKYIKKYAKEYDLPYTEYSVFEAVGSHFKLLKNKGSVENLFQHGEI